MTPFGRRIRELRAGHGISLRTMAADLLLSPAYLSALEHGKRGRPSTGLIHQIAEYFGLIWDDAEELKALARLSDPRVVVDTSALSPAHTELANRLAQRIRELPPKRVERLLKLLRDG